MFLGGGEGKSELLYVAKRENLRQPFRRGTAIRELANQPGPKNPSLSPDASEGAGQLIRGGGNLMVWSRRAATTPFGAPQNIEIDGIPPLLGRCPRYVAATRELFFSRAAPEDGKPNWLGIWVVKNFTPPR